MNTDRRILVVEDNAALASVVRFNLERAGFQVTLAGNGQLAWETLQEEAFDLIVTDQQMPEMTGCELCARLRAHSKFQSLPVIMLTAKGMELKLPELRAELGLAATFLKPFSPRELVTAVDHHSRAVGDVVSQ